MNGEMPYDAAMEIGERLKFAREAKRLTQAQVAEFIQLDQSTVAHWERGKSRPSPDKVDRLAPLLDVDVEWLLFGRGRGPEGAPSASSGPAPNATIPGADVAPRLSMNRDLPIRGRAQGGKDGAIEIGTDEAPIDWTYRPPELIGVRDAFAVYVDGTSMTGAGLRHGATVWAHPHRRPAPGDIVVVVVDPGLAFVKRYVRTAGGKIVVSQTDPPKEFSFPLDKVRGLHLVIGGLFGR